VGILEKIKASTQQNLYTMQEPKGWRFYSVQSSALTFLLNKFETQNTTLATVCVSLISLAFQSRTAHSQIVVFRTVMDLVSFLMKTTVQ
jgi:hypothetical protein